MQVQETRGKHNGSCFRNNSFDIDSENIVYVNDGKNLIINLSQRALSNEEVTVLENALNKGSALLEFSSIDMEASLEILYRKLLPLASAEELQLKRLIKTKYSEFKKDFFKHSESVENGFSLVCSRELGGRSE